MTSTLRVGIIVDGRHASTYIYELVEYLKSDPLLFSDPVLIIQTVAPRTRPKSARIWNAIKKSPRQAAAIALGKLVKDLETRRVRRHRAFRDYGEIRDLSVFSLDEIVVEPLLSASGKIFRYDEHALDTIRKANLDVLVRGGSGILKGEILDSSRHGILSFHHGDNRVYRGGPSGFWEVYLGAPSSGFVVQRLSEELDGGDVLVRGNMMTQPYWAANEAYLLRKSSFFLFRMLTDLARSGKLPEAEPPAPYSSRLFRSPSASVLVKYAARNFQERTSSLVRGKLLKHKGRWGVAYMHCDGLRAALYRAKQIPNPPRRFLADPFVIAHEGRTVCFVEDYFFDDGIGRISAYEIDDLGAKQIGVVLEEPFHLAFPFVFKYCGHIFMCPETCQNKDIRLYRCDRFPDRWSYFMTLMSGIFAADTVLFPWENRWCMLTNICSAGIPENSSELHAFTAEHPLSGEWVPNSRNPVIFDSMRARNAGLFSVNGEVFRVNQVQRKAFYGASAQINRIITLNDYEYVEEKLCEIKPEFFEGIAGAHHYHTNGRLCVFDYLRAEKL